MKTNNILKTVAFSLLITLSVNMTKAQDSLNVKIEKTEKSEKKKDEIITIFGKTKSHGGYFGISTDYALLENNDAIVTGAQFGWIINHSLVLGAAGYGFFSNNIDNTTSIYPQLSGGYGGLLIEPIILPKLPVHLAFPFLFGVGGVSTIGNYGTDNWNYYVENSDVFMVVEPGVELEFNMLKFFRISFGAKYRVTTQLLMPNVNSNALNGLSCGVNLKFGKF